MLLVMSNVISIIYCMCCALISSALDHAHCSSITRARHEVSCAYAQPHQGQLCWTLKFSIAPLCSFCCWLNLIFSLTYFLSSSLQTSVQLNRRVISDLAITEPRSFLSLAKLARARQQEGLRAALGDGKEPAGVFSRVVLLQWWT